MKWWHKFFKKKILRSTLQTEFAVKKTNTSSCVLTWKPPSSKWLDSKQKIVFFTCHICQFVFFLFFVCVHWCLLNKNVFYSLIKISSSKTDEQRFLEIQKCGEKIQITKKPLNYWFILSSRHQINLLSFFNFSEFWANLKTKFELSLMTFKRWKSKFYQCFYKYFYRQISSPKRNIQCNLRRYGHNIRRNGWILNQNIKKLVQKFFTYPPFFQIFFIHKSFLL